MQELRNHLFDGERGGEEEHGFKNGEGKPEVDGAQSFGMGIAHSSGTGGELKLGASKKSPKAGKGGEGGQPPGKRTSSR